MQSHADRGAASLFGAPRPLDAQEQPKRTGRQERLANRDLGLIQDLRKLRRERAERALLDARSGVLLVTERIDAANVHLQELARQYEDRQSLVASAVRAGGCSLEDVRLMLSRVDRALSAVNAAHRYVDALKSEREEAMRLVDEALDSCRQASVAHEKILEWKKVP